MKKLFRLIAVAIMGVSLTTGVAAAQSADVDTTGPNSTVRIDFREEYTARVNNSTDARLNLSNDQFSQSGSAISTRNTTGGGATTGDAENENEVEVEAEIHNSSSNSAVFSSNSTDRNDASVSNTGPDSRVDIIFRDSTDVRVSNDTNIVVSNDNVQTAVTGDATVSRNTSGGDAETGSATNTTSSRLQLHVRN